jgi:hypothetical protein
LCRITCGEDKVICKLAGKDGIEEMLAQEKVAKRALTQ